MLNGLGVAIISTSKGIMTDSQARQQASVVKSCASWPKGERPCPESPRSRSPLPRVSSSTSSRNRSASGPEGCPERRPKPAGIEVKIEDGNALLSANDAGVPLTGTPARDRRQHGAVGVSTGFERKLELVGVGYRRHARART